MKMEDGVLVRAIEQHESQVDGTLQDERSESLDYYLGKPLGNEVDGRSQVVYRTVWDTVEWLKPQIADIFCSGEEIVSFSPKGPEDVQAAQQESDYVNHVVTQKNDWFSIWYAWTHDALIQKNGYVKAYWDDADDLTVERYSDLTQDEFALLLQDQDIEVIEHDERAVAYDAATAYVDVRHTVSVQRKRPRNVVRIENVAPEAIKVDANARSLSLQDPRVAFVEHAEFKTISDLRAEGFDVDDDISDSGNSNESWEDENRDNYDFMHHRADESDPSMRRVRVRECWIRIDYDGDGRAELRHVIVVGTTVLLNEDADTVPIVALCPTPLSHQHVGLSVADAVMDLQKIQTALLRGGLDNQYLANNGRYAVSDNVNLDDMLDSRPGGIVRVVNGAQPGNEIFPLTHPTNGAAVVPMMEYVEKISQKRTGVNEQTQGLDPNALNKTATGATIMMSAAQQRIKFIARIFAETGVKALFQLVHELTLKNSRQQEMVQLRGKWLPVNPRTWVKRNDMTVNVALGTGDKAAQIAMLNQILMIQKEAAVVGIATPQNIYSTLVRLTKTAGYKDENEFWTDPTQAPPRPPPPPDPRIQVEQMRQQADAQRFQAESQMTQQIESMKLQLDKQKAEMQLQVQAANDARDSEREQLKAQYNAQIEQMKLENDRQIAEMQAGVDKYRADLQSQTQVLLKQMELGIDPNVQASTDAVASSLADSNQTLVAAIQAIQAQNEASAQRMDALVKSTAAAMNTLVATASKPRQVVRDPKTNKIIGVQ